MLFLKKKNPVHNHILILKSDNFFPKSVLIRAVSNVISVTEHGLTTEPEENTILNKVVVFAIFGPKCIFDASKHSN